MPPAGLDTKMSASTRSSDDHVSYSDFMRSLAAKYNNSGSSGSNSGGPNGNGEPRLLDSPLANVLAAGAGLFPNSSLPHGPETTSAALALPLLASLAASGKSAFLFPPQQSATQAPTAAAAALLNTMLNATSSSMSIQSPTLSAAKAAIKRHSSPGSHDEASGRAHKRFCPALPCSEASRAVQAWSVNEVCEFVESIELLRPFVGVFREQSIDGLALLLLTEDHLLSVMKLKLGPVLKFKAALASRIGSCPACLHCLHCHSSQPSGGGGEEGPPSRKGEQMGNNVGGGPKD